MKPSMNHLYTIIWRYNQERNREMKNKDKKEIKEKKETQKPYKDEDITRLLII